LLSQFATMNTYIEKQRPKKQHIQNKLVNTITGLNCDVLTLFGHSPLNVIDLFKKVSCKNKIISYEIDNNRFINQCQQLSNSRDKFTPGTIRVYNGDIFNTKHITKCIDLDLMCFPHTVEKQVIELFNKQQSLFKGQRKVFWLTLAIRGYRIENRNTFIEGLLEKILKSKVYIKTVQDMFFLHEGKELTYKNYRITVSDTNFIVEVNTYADREQDKKGGVPMLNIFIESYK